MPLGGRDAKQVIEALERNKQFLRGEIAHRVNLKFAPDIRFRIDERFDEAERIEKILRTPEVQRDLEPKDDDERRMTRRTTLPDAAPSSRRAAPEASQRKREKRDVHGWLVLDKPVGMTSTHAVARGQARCSRRKRAGHAGTLDPLASGLLPIALGEATKTVPFVMDGRKRYRFTVRWGEERDTDDAEGRSIGDQRRAARRRTRSAPACRASPARSRRCRRNSPPSRSTASAPMTSPATARWSSSKPRPVDIHRLDAGRDAGCRSRGFRGRMRQGNLCAGARPRYRPRSRLPRPCRRRSGAPRSARSAKTT